MRDQLLTLLRSTRTAAAFYAVTNSPGDSVPNLLRLQIHKDAAVEVGNGLRDIMLGVLENIAQVAQLGNFASHDSQSTAWEVDVKSGLAVGASSRLFDSALGAGIKDIAVSKDALQGVKGLLVQFSYASKDNDGKPIVKEVRSYFYYYGGAILSEKKYLNIIGTNTLTSAKQPIFKLPSVCVLIGQADKFLVVDLKKYESLFRFDQAINKMVSDSLQLFRSRGIFADTMKFEELIKNKAAFKKRIISAANLIAAADMDLAGLIALHDQKDPTQTGLLKLADGDNPTRILIETQNQAENFCDFCNTDISVNRISSQRSRILSKKDL